MKIVTLRVHKDYAPGPQYYPESRELVPESWPPGLLHSDIEGWTDIGEQRGNFVLREFVANDDWPIDDIPANWKVVSSHKWDMRSKHQFDVNGNMSKSALVAERRTKKTDYKSHKRTPHDAQGNPTGQPANDEREHSFSDWPYVDD